MKRILLFILICVLAVNFAACSKGSDSNKGKKNASTNLSVHGDVTTDTPPVISTPLIDALKKKKLNADSSKTIGEAFDSYKFVTSKEWRETETKNGKVYIDYICWLDVNTFSPSLVKEGVVKRGLEIKFVIHESGEAYITMATRIEIKSDGKTHSTPIEVADIKKIVTSIYENREISF